MPPAVAVTSSSTSSMATTPQSPTKTSREIAASEDIYFGGVAHHHQHPHEHEEQPYYYHPSSQFSPSQQQETTSLLGQALQNPSTGGDHHRGVVGAVMGGFADHSDPRHQHGASSFQERATPTSVTRKRSGDSGNRTPMHQNFNSGAANNNNVSALTLVSSQDPLSMSSRSLQSDWQSDDERNIHHPNNHLFNGSGSIVPQSVDTVPTSNMTSFQHFQRQLQAHPKNKLHLNAPSSINPHPQPPNNEGEGGRLCLSPPPQLRFHKSHAPTPIAATTPSASVTTTERIMGGATHTTPTNANTMSTAEEGQQPRRTVFGSRVQQRYPNVTQNHQGNLPIPVDEAPFYNIIENGGLTVFRQAEPQPPAWKTKSGATPPPSPAAARNNHDTSGEDDNHHAPLPMIVTASTNTSDSPSIDDIHQQTQQHLDNHGMYYKTPRNSILQHNNPFSLEGGLDEGGEDRYASLSTIGNDDMAILPQALSVDKEDRDVVSPLQSPLTNRVPPSRLVSKQEQQQQTNNSTTCSYPNYNKNNPNNRSAISTNSTRRRKNSHHHHKGKPRIHETVHAQSLLLGLCFMAIWSPNNVMAPNLTQIATYYNMTVNERDLYLGSFLALATGVLSFPISALIGIWTDLYSRKILFVGTALGGSIASAATGLSPTYPCLLLARFFSGGFMSASTSVAFSLLGDLFATEERNAASSGLTAMMGMGIILGQVYAGAVGNTKGWQYGFYVSSVLSGILGICVAIWVQEPVRGGKEKVLQDMLLQGKRYDRKLTWDGFWNAMRNNRSNRIIMAQGFFSSIPWGIIFVFLNDYLSQERGFSVPDATFIVLVFGIGCAVGGIIGGTLGSRIQSFRRSLLPIFMAGTTLLGVLPFIGLLNGHTTNAHGYWAVMYSFMGGCISSMPSVNVRPCLINVNPPETRGASLTAANLIINFARGIGPSCITILGSSFHLNRQLSFNVTLVAFWALSAMQLCFLAQSLPHDQDKMETELARYAASALGHPSPSKAGTGPNVYEDYYHSPVKASLEFSPQKHATDKPDSSKALHDDDSLVSIEDRMTTFDVRAARESIAFFQKGVSELASPLGNFCAVPHGHRYRDGVLLEFDEEEDSEDYYEDGMEDFEDDDEKAYDDDQQRLARNILNQRQEGDDAMSPVDLLKRRDLWLQHQKKLYGSTDEGERNATAPGGASSQQQQVEREERGNDAATPTERTHLMLPP